MLGRASRALRGLRPVRVATVAQALLRAFCGQLIEAKRARRLEQTIIRTICPAGPSGLHSRRRRAISRRSPGAASRARAPRRPRASLVRLCRTLELERLHDVPTECRRRAAGARARPRAVVGRRRLPRRARPLRLRARRRPRSRQAPARAPRAAGRRLGDGRAARAVRRVGGDCEHVSARRLAGSRGLLAA